MISSISVASVSIKVGCARASLVSCAPTRPALDRAGISQFPTMPGLSGYCFGFLLFGLFTNC